MVKSQVVSVRLSRLRLASADAIAKRRGISRSQLIDEALRLFSEVESGVAEWRYVSHPQRDTDAP
jgi:metal-responsive CopG/Arc/MetJ family transcriptional regulator